MEELRRTDDGTYPNVTEERAKTEARPEAPAVDWSRLSPAQVYQALQTAPSKVVGPWEPVWMDGDQERYPPCRRTPGGATVVWDIGGKVSIHSWATAHGQVLVFDSRAEADAKLKELGWLIVD